MNAARRAAAPLAASALAAAALVATPPGDNDRPGRAPQPALLQVAIPRGAGGEDVATAFALRSGRAVTVAHVLEGRRVGANVAVRSPGPGRGDDHSATIVAIDERDDLAILAVPGLRARAARLGTGAGDVAVLTLRGARVLSVPARLRRAIVAWIRTPDGRRIVHRPTLELTADILPGDSGAPVVTDDGSVAGVVFARSDGRPRIAYAVDASALTAASRDG
jgi:S1-C subfamily serine protease